MERIAQVIFMNAEGELRCGWRILTFIVLFSASSMLLRSFAVALAGVLPSFSSVVTPPKLSGTATTETLVSFAVDRVLSLTATVAATVICARLLERRSFGSVGYKLHAGWSRDLGLGCAVGSASLALAVAIQVAAGAVDFEPTRSSGLPVKIAILLIVFIIAAAFEELLFRGFAFQALVHNVGPGIAIVLSALVFGLMHSLNPNATVLSTANTTLAGIWLGTAYLTTRSLWTATGLHYAWNLATVSIFGLPVSGVTLFEGLSVLDGRPSALIWLSGGSYGPEGGAAATIALGLSTVAIWKSGLFAPSGYMLEAVKHGRSQAVSSS